MNIKKILGVLVSLNILQIVLTMIIVALVRDNHEGQLSYMIYGACLLIVFSAFITVLGYSFISKAKNTNLLESMKNLEALNGTLRKQRHDYLNQMQVVYGLLDLNEYEDAKSYMDSIFKEILKVSKALKTKQPAVNALLQAKLQMAEANGIDLYIDVKADLQELVIEPWELCKVLANIIDNGMTALALKEDNKELFIHIDEEKAEYLFEITNNGPEIPKNKLEMIFTEGYSTKGEKGHGMGLAIVQEIIKREKGSIEISSNKDRTSFKVALPKKKAEQ